MNEVLTFVCSDSLSFVARGAWHPAIRREHSLSRSAVDAGHRVRFIAPRRSVQLPTLQRIINPGGVMRLEDSITLIERGLELPSHRSNLINGINSRLIRRALQPTCCQGTVVTYRPWEWAASRGAPRRIFDCVDPWPDLLPEAQPLIYQWLRRIADEADEIIVVTDELADLFPGRPVRTVPNAVDDHLLATPPRPAPGNMRLLYLGSICHRRLDLDLIDRLLIALPEWSLDLVGPNFLDDQSPTMTSIRAMQSRHGSRLRLLPAVDGRAIVDVIDACDLMIAPFVPGITSGQSSKKSFDAAARGRAIVTASGVALGLDDSPPDQRVADDLDGWVEAIRSGPSSTEMREQSRAWAQRNSWTLRFDEWSRWAIGSP